MKHCFETVIPQLFFGMHDEDSNIRAIYENAWDEGIGGTYFRIYSMIIYDKVLLQDPGAFCFFIRRKFCNIV